MSIGRVTRKLSTALLLPLLALMSGCGTQTHEVSSISGERVPPKEVSQNHGCPSSDRSFTASNRPDAARVLVPAQPIGALICRYWSANDAVHRERTFAEARIVSSAAALQRMVRRLDALPPYPVRGPISCPVLGGRSELMFFRYGRGGADPVRISRECHVPISNGRLVKAGLGLGPPEGHWPDEGLL